MLDDEQIDKAIRYNDEVNCDITISSSLAYLNYMDTVKYLSKPKDKVEKRKLWGYQLRGGLILQNA
jgi:hypothetical protein